MTINRPNVIVIFPDGTWDTSARVLLLSDAEMQDADDTGDVPASAGRTLAFINQV